jgi:HSP20 family protein
MVLYIPAGSQSNGVEKARRRETPMTTPAKRERPMFADLVDWLEGEFPALPMMRPFGGQVMRVEDYVDDGQYVVRAELPGVDPEKDVDLTVENGVLTIRAERREEKKEGGRSEFRYGSFTRSVTLPPGADENDVTATYTNGILEVRVAIKPEQKPERKRITIGKKSPSA